MLVKVSGEVEYEDNILEQLAAVFNRRAEAEFRASPRKSGTNFVPDPRLTSACRETVGMQDFADRLGTLQECMQQPVVGMDFAGRNGGSCNNAILPSQGAAAR